jgi:AMP-polyphosphate phosphotransferase
VFQSAALKHKLSKQAYAEQEPKMREKLLHAQLELAEKKSFAVVILVAGIDGAGKGEAIARLYEWMDPHHLHCNAYGEPTEEEHQRPPMWRYWRDLPPKGETAIVFGSWYQEPMRDRVLGTIDDNAFERVLYRDPAKPCRPPRGRRLTTIQDGC